MIEWKKTSDKLPNDGQLVLVYDGDFQVAKFERGISMAEREKMNDGELENPTEHGWRFPDGCVKYKRSECYRESDEFGNNTMPYCWRLRDGHTVFGQNVSFWSELSDPLK